MIKEERFELDCRRNFEDAEDNIDNSEEFEKCLDVLHLSLQPLDIKLLKRLINGSKDQIKKV